MIKGCHGVDDVRRKDPRQQRGRREDNQRQGDDARDGTPRLALAVERDALHEDRQERGADDTTNHEVVERVGNGVGEVESVSEGSEAQDVGEHQGAH